MLRTRVRAGPFAGVVLSLFFASLLAVLQSFDLYIASWTPGIGRAVPVSVRVPYGSRIVRDHTPGGSSVAYGHGRVIIPPGTKLLEHNEEHRAGAAYESLRRPPSSSRMIAFAAVNFTLGVLLTVYLRRFGQSRVRLLRTQIGIFAAILVVMAVAKLMLLFTPLPEYWIPAAVLPLWVSLAFDRRTGFLVSIVLGFVVASFLRLDVVLLMVVLVRGMASTLLFLDRKRPRQMLWAGALSGLVACGLYTAISVIFEGGFDLLRDLADPPRSIMIANVGGGVVSGILAVLLREPVERLLGVVSRDKLLHLADLEQPLLKKMSSEAPGSWEHARSMANLAEAAAAAIGADALLVRVGAYYHDLGKTVQPEYFVENLAPGDESPHCELDPEVSADAIMAHVVLGTKILRDGGIPEPVVEFAYTHHGTQVVEYFWNKCLETGNPKGLTEDYFRYPGMKPQTKETAILMLVDSIEAASRTVDPPDREHFEQMIQRVVFTKLRAGQLSESGLSIGDLHTLVERMSEALANMFHHRIRYPWQEQQRPASHFTTPIPSSSSASSVRAIDAPALFRAEGVRQPAALSDRASSARASQPSIPSIPLERASRSPGGLRASSPSKKP